MSSKSDEEPLYLSTIFVISKWRGSSWISFSRLWRHTCCCHYY
jgi:hypothetical protein